MLFNFAALAGGDPGIAQTAAKIRSMIHYALREPNQAIRRRAESIIRAAGVPERREPEEIAAIFQWVKAHFHYVHDPRGIEYIKSPEFSDKEITDYGEFMGDCDDAVAYLAALLKSFNYDVKLIVIADHRARSNNFQHIYLAVYSPQMKKWVSLDPTAKQKPAGWNATAKRLREYDV